MLKNWHFSKGVNSLFWSKNGHFSNFFFYALQTRKISQDILVQIMPFQVIKKRSLNSRKSDIFPKGLTHGIGPKRAIFRTFFLRRYRPGKCILRYSRKKKMPFQAIKTRSSKSRKIDIFPKGLTHVIGPKTVVFPTFLLRQYKPGKCLLRYSRTKKCLSRL